MNFDSTTLRVHEDEFTHSIGEPDRCATLTEARHTSAQQPHSEIRSKIAGSIRKGDSSHRYEPLILTEREGGVKRGVNDGAIMERTFRLEEVS